MSQTTENINVIKRLMREQAHAVMKGHCEGGDITVKPEELTIDFRVLARDPEEVAEHKTDPFSFIATETNSALEVSGEGNTVEEAIADLREELEE